MASYEGANLGVATPPNDATSGNPDTTYGNSR